MHGTTVKKKEKKEERNDWKCGNCGREERSAYKILLGKSKEW
jgi:hypothetical protein